MKSWIFFGVVVLLVLGVQGADKSPEKTRSVTLQTSPQKHSDNVASASITSAKSVLPPSKKVVTREKDEHIETAATQHQYDHRQQQGQGGHIRAHPQQLVSQRDYLALLEREAEAFLQNGGSGGGVDQSPQYEKPITPERIANSFYARNPNHPLAGSSLEKEIEKLIGSTAQSYPLTAHNTEVAATHNLPPPGQQSVGHGDQNAPPQQQQYNRSPVVFKNQNDIVYIPYQHQVLRDQYGRPAGPGVTKAKVEYISAYPTLRAPLPPPGEAIEYGRNPQAPQFVPARPQESFKEAYIQQQRENHLKRLQQHHHHQQQQQQQQLANDNLNLQSHAQPLSIDLLPKKHAPPQSIAEQGANSNIAQFAERLFQTPLAQQKPLSQEQFKALVAAGYPVEAVPVPVAVSAAKGPAYAGPQSAANYPHLVQRYSPASLSLPYPQPFSHPKSPAPVQLQPGSQQINRQYAPPTQHQNAAPAAPSPAPHRFYPQGQYPRQPQLSGAGDQRYAGPFTYILQQGENEESAAEQLRRQIIQEINSQSQKGVVTSGSQVAPQISGQTRVIYPPTNAQLASVNAAAGQGQTQATSAGPSSSPQKPEDQQREYYKRLEYY